MSALVLWVADLWEVGASRGLMGPRWTKKRLGGGERLLGGAVSFLRQRSHHSLLG